MDNKIENKELFEKCLIFVNNAVIELMRTNEGRIILSQIFDDFPTILDFEKYCKSKKEFEEIIDYLFDKLKLKELYRKIDVEKLLIKLFIDCIDPLNINLFRFINYSSGNLIKIINSVSEEIYPKFENELFDKYWHYIGIAPIRNFISDVDELKLSNEVSMVKRSINIENEIRNLFDIRFRLSTFGNIINRIDFQWTSYLLIIRKAKRKDGDNPLHNSVIFESDFIDVIKRLRLFKNGDLGINSYYIGLSSRFYSDYSHSKYWYKICYRRPFGIEYSFNSSDLKNYKIFENDLKCIYPFKENKDTSYLSLAIRYFNYAKEIENLDDKLIYYIISLEALFLTEKAELNYRLSHRIANLQGDRNNREDVRKFIHDMYSKRSDIVHGTKIVAVTKDEINSLSEYTRRAINGYLFLNANGHLRKDIKNKKGEVVKKGIHHSLDECIYDNDKRNVIIESSSKIINNEQIS